MPSLYVHLGLEERRRIYRLREAKMPIAEIAAALGRHRSTVHREIARNWWHDAQMPQAEGYWPLTAQDLAVRRRHAGAKLERHAELAAAVIDRLRAGWSPEQIAGRLRVEPAAPHRLCHETIYRFVYGPTGQSEELARHLPRRRRRRRPRFARKPRSPVFPDRVAIRHRPATVKDRAEFGHWGEAGPWPLWGRVSPPNDLMMFRREHGAANVATVVERTTRYTMVFRNSDRRVPTHHGPPHRRARAPARRGPALDHLRPRARVRLLARTRRRPRGQGVARTTPRRRGRRAQWRTPTAAFGVICRGTPTCCRCRTGPSRRSATASTPRPASASASAPRPRRSKTRSWSPIRPADTLPTLAVAPRLELIHVSAE